MPGYVDRRLCSPADPAAGHGGEETVGKSDILTQIIVADIDVSAPGGFDVANNLLDRALPVNSLMDSGNRTVLAGKWATARRLDRIDHQPIFFNQIVSWDGQVGDVYGTD